jgi:hypothetical protein
MSCTKKRGHSCPLAPALQREASASRRAGGEGEGQFDPLANPFSIFNFHRSDINVLAGSARLS